MGRCRYDYPDYDSHWVLWGDVDKRGLTKEEKTLLKNNAKSNDFILCGGLGNFKKHYKYYKNDLCRELKKN